MNAISRFADWLTPSIPFEFIKSRASDECATLLTSKTGARSGPFFQRIRTEVTFDPDNGGYSFRVNLYVGGFLVEAHGTISALAEAYSQIEGSARTQPSLITLVFFGVGLVFFSAIIISLIHALFEVNTFASALIPAAILIGFPIVGSFIQVHFQKWIMETYTDMVMGFLLRSL